MDDSSFNLILGAVALTWVFTGILTFVNASMQGRSKKAWVFHSLLLGPFGLIVLLFPPRRKGEPAKPAKQYKEEDFFKRTPPFAFEIKDLKKNGRLEEAADLLMVLLEEVERKARRMRRPVPGWYYHQLESVYRKQGRSDKAEKIRRRRQENAGAA